MLRFQGTLPLDYSLCAMTVTVYHREGLTRQVLDGVHFECTHTLDSQGGIHSGGKEFLLVIPGPCAIAPGDKVVPGTGPELTDWARLDGFTARSVKPRYYMGRYCHTEVRGQT